jgi:hypothetical protein
MIECADLVQAFARNLSIMQRQAEGLTQADSLLQPPVRGNCLNWVLGHLANNRDSLLQLLGQEPVLGEAGARYRRESEPVTGEGEGVLPLCELLAALERSQPALERALSLATPEMLAKEVPFAGRTMPVAQRVFFMYFHETYHTGQTELLRQLAGKNDKII